MISVMRAYDKELQVKHFRNKVELLEYLLKHPEEHWHELKGSSALIPSGEYKRKQQQTPQPQADCTCHKELHTLKLRLASLVS